MRINKTKYSTRRIIRWLWSHHKACRTQAIANIVIGVLQVALSLAGVETLRRLVDIATGSREGEILPMAGVFAAIMIAEMILTITSTWISASLGVRTQNNMQRSFFARLLKGQWSGIERHHSGDTLNRLFGDVGDIVRLMTEVLPSAVIIILQFVASFIYLHSMDATLAYMLIFTTPFFILLSRIYFRRMRRIVRKIKDSNSTLQSIIQESVQHKMVIKVLERTPLMLGRLSQRQDLLHSQVKSRAKLSIYSKSVINLGFAATFLIALTWGLFQLQDGAITVGILMAFTQLINRIQRPLLNMARLLPVFVNSLTSSERLMELEELPLEPTTQPHHMNGATGIRLENITYKYTEKGRSILTNFTHDFRPGSFTAILGQTGAGKTTIMRLMLSLITPVEGKVILYNTNGEAQASTDTRCNFSYVPQGNTLFSGTIRDNLLMGNPTATTEQMHAALHTAMADFALTLPNGLDTLCGEQGGGLSEGQAQRIAIARALLRPCRIILLDEATSALDTVTERQLLDNIKTQLTGTTVILVTHRHEALQFATEQITLR